MGAHRNMGAAAQGVKLVLATVTVIGEKRAGTNGPNDHILDTFQVGLLSNPQAWAVQCTV